MSDSPNVNLLFREILNDERKEVELNKLIVVNTCGLHMLHITF